MDKGISEGIVELCKLHNFTPQQTKDKAKELAMVYWEDNDRGQNEAMAFWKFPDKIKSNENKDEKSDCFIATVAFCDQNAPEVITLRLYRDLILSKTTHGCLFISFYYRIGPIFAEILRKKGRFKQLSKNCLRPYVSYCTSSLLKLYSNRYFFI